MRAPATGTRRHQDGAQDPSTRPSPAKAGRRVGFAPGGRPSGTAESAVIPRRAETASPPLDTDPLQDPHPSLGAVLRWLKAQQVAAAEKAEAEGAGASFAIAGQEWKAGRPDSTLPAPVGRSRRGSSARGGRGPPPGNAHPRPRSGTASHPSAGSPTGKNESATRPVLRQAQPRASSLQVKFGRQTAANVMRSLGLEGKVRLKAPEAEQAWHPEG